MENVIQGHKDFVRSQIEKSFGEEIDIEKAHNVGDVHPNGKWVWTEYAPGKFDWRNKKTKVDTPQQKSVAAKKVLDFLQLSNNKFNDITKVGALKTDKGNWALSYDGHDVCTVGGKSLSEKTLKDAGVKIEDPNKDAGELKKRESDLSSSPVGTIVSGGGYHYQKTSNTSSMPWKEVSMKNGKVDEAVSSKMHNTKSNYDLAVAMDSFDDFKIENNSDAKLKAAADDLHDLILTLDNWDDSDWMDKEMNAQFDSKMRALITKHELSEKDFKSLAKRYQGYDLNYTDYIPNGSYKYKKYNGEA